MTGQSQDDTTYAINRDEEGERDREDRLTQYKTFHSITDVTCNVSIQLVEQLYHQ